MTSTTIRKSISKIAKEMRIALEKASKLSSSLVMTFPNGCCGTASDFLSKYLEQNGIRTTYVAGMKTNRITHAWLEYDDLIIDITADQFPEIDEKVLVSRNRHWYEQYERISRSEAYDFLDVNSLDRQDRIDFYNRIVQLGYLASSAMFLS